MLKITKNQIKKGQEVVVNMKQLLDKLSTNFDANWIFNNFTKNGFKDGDILTIIGLRSGLLHFTHDGKKYNEYWSQFKMATEIEDGGNLGSDSVEYVIFLDGVKIGNKYKDMGKVKTSLLGLMNYYDKLEKLINGNSPRVPELVYTQIPDFIGTTLNLKRDDFGRIEIFTWKDRKIGEGVEFDAVSFYDESMILVKVTARFGSSTRDLFKETKDTHKYILTFLHEDYREKRYPDYDRLKESDIIKNAIEKTFGRTMRSLGIKKKNKSGKTSLAFKEQSEVIRIMRELPDGSFFICNMQGEEIVEESESLIRQEWRDSLIEEIIS